VQRDDVLSFEQQRRNHLPRRLVLPERSACRAVCVLCWLVLQQLGLERCEWSLPGRLLLSRWVIVCDAGAVQRVDVLSGRQQLEHCVSAGFDLSGSFFCGVALHSRFVLQQ
jgi:hypothetical protein